ncbi:MAG: tandem-95 repeat protein, partial [Gammaproteobacteria bacterium]
RLQFNDDSDSDMQFTQGINYPAPGNTQSREPLVINALGYQGWLDGQATLGRFETLLNWRKNDQCTVTLCDDAADPASCQANSSDIFAELNTDCVGVADGFMGYNHQSWPMSYLAIWPTGWFQSDKTGSSGWNDGGHGDLNQLAFPEVRNDEGFDDSSSLWFRNTDQISTPLCFAGNDFSNSPSVPCVDQRRLVLSQKITLAAQTLDNNSPQTYRVALRYRTLNVATAVDLRVRLFIHETGSGDAQIDYGVQTLASLTPVDTTGWVSAEVLFTLNPLLHNTSSYDGLKITLDTANTFAGDLGIDVVSVQLTTEGLELVRNGSFSLGHHQAVSGDHAANFLNRLGGVAAWGSVGHHQSSGCAFCFNGLESMIYFLRGLPLGDAVWFSEEQNSGILYGDPLYSPVAVRLNPLNSVEIQNGSVDLVGSTVNGRDLLQVNTSYTVDVCTAGDFYLCDQAQSWQATGISGPGGSNNALLGTLDTSLLATDDFTLRLQVSSLNTLTGSSQVFADYFTMSVNDPPVAMDANLNVVVDTDTTAVFEASDEEGAALVYSISSNGSKGNVTILNPVSGFYRYSPNASATGADSFTFKVNDGLLDSNIATVSVSITALNDAPVANNGNLNTNQDVAVNGMLSASDVDGNSLTYLVVTNGGKGTAIITNTATGAYTYTPIAGTTGIDSFTFIVNDGLVDSNIASITINLAQVNDAPIANNGNLNIDEDVTVSAV